LLLTWLFIAADEHGYDDAAADGNLAAGKGTCFIWLMAGMRSWIARTELSIDVRQRQLLDFFKKMSYDRCIGFIQHCRMAHGSNRMFVS